MEKEICFSLFATSFVNHTNQLIKRPALFPYKVLQHKRNHGLKKAIVLEDIKTQE